jgi:hypothetical protein
MGHLMLGDPQLGLEAAYESACWATPAIREKVQSAAAAKAVKAAKVKKAPEPSIDDLLQEGLERLGMAKPSKRIPIR